MTKDYLHRMTMISTTMSELNPSSTYKPRDRGQKSVKSDEQAEELFKEFCGTDRED